MADKETSSPVEPAFDSSRKQARRAQTWLNILVVMSAAAGSAFFVYVLITIYPFGGREAPEVNVPTSTVAERLGILEGEDLELGLYVILRDIDEAPEYRAKLSDQMRQDLEIESNGRLYLLLVRNDGEASATVNARRLQVKDGDGRDWNLKWLRDVTDAESAGSVGRMRLAQSNPDFALDAGQSRQLYVFATGESGAPPAEDFNSGQLELSSGANVSLKHVEVKVAER